MKRSGLPVCFARRVTLVLIELAFCAVLACPAPAVSAAPAGSFVPGELIIGLADGVEFDTLALPKGVSPAPTGRGLMELNAALLHVPVGKEETLRPELLALPGVLFAEPNYLLHAAAAPDDPRYPEQYGPAQIGAEDAWNLTTGSSRVIVAVLDSGIDAGHPEFAGRLLPGYDFIENDRTPQDLCGHGTHVAGIIAATGNNGEGVAGIDWGARILPVRVLDANCSGGIETIADGIVWALEQGARVINLSLGAASLRSRLLEYATYYAYRHGAALIASAGNAGTSGVYVPAAYPWVMAVGYTGPDGQRDTHSNYGPDLDIMAPGAGILSTTPRSGTFFYQRQSGTTNTYGYLSGTSMAAGFVSGAASLLAGQAQFNTPSRIYDALTASAHDMGSPGFDNLTGYGLLRIDDALSFTPGGSPPPVYTPPPVEYDLLSSARCQNLVSQWESVPHNLSAYPAGNLAVFPGDNQANTIDLPFTFNYAGVNYTRVTISSNGLLAFDATGEQPPFGPYQNDNFIIPVSNSDSAQAPMQPFGSDEFLAPFWDDLRPSTTLDDTRKIYAVHLPASAGQPERFVVEWYRVPLTLGGEVTFQVVLYRGTNEVRFQYGNLSGNGSDGSSATIGVEYNAGHSGLLLAYNQPGAVRQGMAVHFYPRPAGAPGSAPPCEASTQVTSANATVDLAPFCLEMNGFPPATPYTTVRISTFRAFPPARFFPSASLGWFADITLSPSPDPPLEPQPRVCFHYSTADLLAAGGSPDNLFFAVYDVETRQWERLATEVDAGTGRLLASVPHFSVFGVFYLPQPKSLPVTGAAAPATGTAWLFWAAGLASFAGLTFVLRRRLKCRAPAQDDLR